MVLLAPGPLGSSGCGEFSFSRPPGSSWSCLFFYLLALATAIAERSLRHRRFRIATLAHSLQDLQCLLVWAPECGWRLDRTAQHPLRPASAQRVGILDAVAAGERRRHIHLFGGLGLNPKAALRRLAFRWVVAGPNLLFSATYSDVGPVRIFGRVDLVAFAYVKFSATYSDVGPVRIFGRVDLVAFAYVAEIACLTAGKSLSGLIFVCLGLPPSRWQFIAPAESVLRPASWMVCVLVSIPVSVHWAKLGRVGLQLE